MSDYKFISIRCNVNRYIDQTIIEWVEASKASNVKVKDALYKLIIESRKETLINPMPKRVDSHHLAEVSQLEVKELVRDVPNRDDKEEEAELNIPDDLANISLMD